jgi:nucleoside 2-deoxyribosyltransferase/fructose-1-phosphate kinase PfkB-like protein
MSGTEPIPLLIGEVFIDFTVTAAGSENKLRLGGIAHAARGFWVLDMPFRAAVILPEYLEEAARKYFKAFGCVDFRVVGQVRGAPNVTVLFDQIELADQGYDTLLREEKMVELLPAVLADIACKDVLIFPGSFDLLAVCAALPSTAKLHIDIAYDIDNPEILAAIPQQIETILISTSSPLFKSVANDSLDGLIEAFKACAPVTVIVKENRGGSRMVVSGEGSVVALPAQLGTTKNSVGVGDVFAANYVSHYSKGRVEAAWRATFAAAAYSQTTEPDLFKAYVKRDLRLDFDELQQLGGVFLPWEMRRNFSIYLAAPDFSYANRSAIDTALASLSYHNFNVRRPIVENGELPPGSSPAILQRTYRSDYDLLKECALVFAVPTERDPGTLVEIGIAIEAKIPVIVYDPTGENENTMVVAGADFYSADLDQCLSSVFRILSGVASQ